MGNNASKPPGGQQSPVASHSSNSSASHSYSRKEAKSNPARSGSTSQQSSHLLRQPQSSSSSPSQPNYSRPKHSPPADMGNELSRQEWKDKANKAKAEEKKQSTPVRVPRADQKRQKGPDTQFEPSGPPRDPNWIPPSNLNFPPRLPLPIEEELHTPGSPIITSAGESSALHEDDIEGVLPRQSSVVSSTTLDEDEYENELQPYPAEDSSRFVPTTVRWKQGGDKVYVTGTFTAWSRKFRMNRE